MAHRSDTANGGTRRTRQFRSAGVCVDTHTIQYQGIITYIIIDIVATKEIPLMWPNRVALRSARLWIAGIGDIDILHRAIPIPVVVGKVHLIIYKLTSLGYHLLGMGIAASLVILTIIRHFMRHRNGTNDIKLNIKLSIALVAEVLSYRAVIFPVWIAYGIKHVIKDFSRRTRLHLNVFEVDKDEQAFLSPPRSFRRNTHALRCLHGFVYMLCHLQTLEVTFLHGLPP